MDEETGQLQYVDKKPAGDVFEDFVDWSWQEENQYIKDEVEAFLSDFHRLSGELVEAIYYRPSPDGVNAWVEVVMFRGASANLMLERGRVISQNPYLKYRLKQKVKVKQPPRRNKPKAKAKAAGAGKGHAKGKGKGGKKGAQAAAPAAAPENNVQNAAAQDSGW